MCDYSLTGLPNRLAVEGEELVVQRFPTGSMGLAPACPSLSRWWSGKQTPAVCVPPGARLILFDVPEGLQRDLAVGPSEEVTFVQLSATPYQYRDAVRFRNGREIRLQDLKEGLRVDVRSLSSGDSETAEGKRLEEEDRRVFL